MDNLNQRPFCKVTASIANNASGAFTFFDSSGVQLLIDHIQVMPTVSSTTTGYFWVQPSGLNNTVKTLADASAVNTSGAYGAAGTAYWPVDLYLGAIAPDACLGIIITNRLGIASQFIVNYGIRTLPSFQRQDLANRGG